MEGFLLVLVGCLLWLLYIGKVAKDDDDNDGVL